MRDCIDRWVPYLSGLPHLPGVPHLHVNRPLVLVSHTKAAHWLLKRNISFEFMVPLLF